VQELLKQAKFSPTDLLSLPTQDGEPVYYLPIKIGQAEKLLQELRMKASGSHWCPVLAEDKDRLIRLASNSCSFLDAPIPSVEEIAVQIAQTERIPIQKARDKAPEQQRLCTIEKSGLKAAASTTQIIEAGENCDLELWLRSREKLGALADRTYSLDGRSTAAKYLEILGPDEMFKQQVEERAQWDLKEIIICFVPVHYSWQIPAFFRYGGTVNCPSPVVNTAFIKRMHDRYGAEVASIDTTFFELQLSEAPKSTEVESLAKELAIYSKYIGDRSLTVFQKSLSQSTVWSFYS